MPICGIGLFGYLQGCGINDDWQDVPEVDDKGGTEIISTVEDEGEE